MLLLWISVHTRGQQAPAEGKTKATSFLLSYKPNENGQSVCEHCPSCVISHKIVPQTLSGGDRMHVCLWESSISLWQVGRTQPKILGIWREEIPESYEPELQPSFSPPENSNSSWIVHSCSAIHIFFEPCVFSGLFWVVKEQLIMRTIASLTYPNLLGWLKRFFLDKFKIKSCWENEDQHSGRRSPWGEKHRTGQRLT